MFSVPGCARAAKGCDKLATEAVHDDKRTSAAWASIRRRGSPELRRSTADQGRHTQHTAQGQERGTIGTTQHNRCSPPSRAANKLCSTSHRRRSADGTVQPLRRHSMGSSGDQAQSRSDFKLAARRSVRDGNRTQADSSHDSAPRLVARRAAASVAKKAAAVLKSAMPAAESAAERLERLESEEKLREMQELIALTGMTSKQVQHRLESRQRRHEAYWVRMRVLSG